MFRFTSFLSIALSILGSAILYQSVCVAAKFRTTVIEEKTHVHLDIELDLSKEELDKLLKSIGL